MSDRTRSIRRTLAAVAAAAFATLGTSAALAHGTWMAKLHGEYTVMYGHEESLTDGYDPKRIIDARAIKGGQTVPAVVVQRHRHATLQSDAPGILGYTLDNGFWYQLQSGKWVNQPKTHAPAGEALKRAVRSFKYVVSYLNNREAPRALGYDLEIVPAVNPAKLKVGDKLDVQVLWRGQPVAGVKLEPNYFDAKAPTITTDAAGRATVPVLREGFNTIAVDHTPAFEDRTQADEYTVFAALSFRSADANGHMH